jgi:hypothetical protein
VAKEVEHLPSKCKALRTAKKKKKGIVCASNLCNPPIDFIFYFILLPTPSKRSKLSSSPALYTQRTEGSAQE